MTNALGFDKAPQDTRVVVAMSGGVDSSVTAAWLAEQGFDVIGITLQLYDHGAAVSRAKACCAGQDIYDARAVADAAGFPHYVLDYESRFRDSVMDDFADSYVRGETPIPCVRCNQTVKFHDLLGTARELEADCLATGHYVRRGGGLSGAELLRAVDPGKDQSYFLFATTQDQLDYLRFPLGGLMKSETRALADRLGLAVADKPDSQDICFVPNGNYQRIVERLRPDGFVPGDIVDLSGRVLGQHRGVAAFTIGQRRGLNLGAGETGGEALYVVRLEPDHARVIVGPRSALLRDLVYIKETNWLGPQAADLASPRGARALVKLRNTMAPVPATIFGRPGARAVVRLDEPLEGLSPGQACVAYDRDQVLGGGWITGTEASDAVAAQQGKLEDSPQEGKLEA